MYKIIVKHHLATLIACLPLTLPLPSEAAADTIFEINFNDEEIGQPPASGFHGEQVSIFINENSGSILVIDGKGDLLDKPLEMTDTNDPEQCILVIRLKNAISTGRMILEWDALLGEILQDNGWGPVIVVDGLEGMLFTLFYLDRTGSFSNGFEILPGKFTPLLHNHFILDIDLSSYTSTLYIDEVMAGHDIPFSAYYNSKSKEFVQVTFYTGSMNRHPQNFVLDNIKAEWIGGTGTEEISWSLIKK